MQFTRDTGAKIAELEKRTKPKHDESAEHMAAGVMPGYQGTGVLAIADVAYNQMQPQGYGGMPPPGYGGGGVGGMPQGYGAPGMMPPGYGGLPPPGYGMPQGGMY